MIYLRKFESHSQYEAFTGTSEFIKPNTSLCLNENEVHYNPKPHNYSQDYLTFIAKADGTFKFSGNSVSYSIDNGQTWLTLASDTDSPTVAAGNRIMWKASGLTPTSSIGIGRFSSTVQFDVEGNAMSLVSGDDFVSATTVTANQFIYLFNGCTGVTSAENLVLPAATLRQNCYQGMFNGCTSLTTAPALPATTLSNECYKDMFAGCTSLTTAPVLPATKLESDCYYQMFNGCTGLTTAPELPAKTLASDCYYGMFTSCTSLTTAPALPATTLAYECYSYMFSSCKSLTTAPVLPAKTLTTRCYEKMFYSCTSLNYIKAMFTTKPSSTYTNYWVSGVAASGTFVKNSAATWNVTGKHGVPTGWTVQTAAA